MVLALTRSLISTDPFPAKSSIDCNKYGLINSNNLLPNGREERGVLRVGGIPVAILPSCQYMKLLYHNCIGMNIKLGRKNKKHLRGSI